jgi:hypothetical protein
MDERIYLTFNYPGAVSGSQTLLTGIRGKESLLYISGFYESPDSPTVEFVYRGDITGKTGPCSKNSWNVLGYPSRPGVTVTGTNLYGPDVLKHCNIRTVGNYFTEETGDQAFGCMYQGSLDGRGKWLTLTPPDSFNTVAHSTQGDLVVGNYDAGPGTISRAFIYDIVDRTYQEIIKPQASIISAYGIWHNCGSHYTICGGYSDSDIISGLSTAYLVDYNRATHEFTNWRSYHYMNDDKTTIITHFNGITSDGCDGYNLAGDFVQLTESGAFFAHVGRHKNGSFSRATWSQVSYPDSTATSGN